MILNKFKVYLTEVIGAFVWVFFLSLSLQKVNQNEKYIFEHSINISFIIGALTWGTIYISKSQFNPAITLSLIITKKITKLQGLLAIFYQIIGCILAVLLLYILNPYIVNKKENIYIDLIPKDKEENNILNCFITEFFCSFFYMLGFYGTIFDKRSSAGFIGYSTLLSLLVMILSSNSISVNSFNSITFLGTFVFNPKFINFIPFFISPVLGSITGSLIYDKFFLFNQPKESDMID